MKCGVSKVIGPKGSVHNVMSPDLLGCHLPHPLHVTIVELSLPCNHVCISNYYFVVVIVYITVYVIRASLLLVMVYQKLTVIL